MKRICMTCCLLAVMASCKKEETLTPIEQPTASTLQKDAAFVNQSAGTPKANIEVARFKYSPGSTNRKVQFNYEPSGSNALLNVLKDLRVVIYRSATDSVQLTDTKVQSGWWPDTVGLSKNKTYRISVYVSAPSLVFGTMGSDLEIDDGQPTTQKVTGQMAVFGYAVAPIVTDVVAGGSTTVVNGDRVGFSVKVSAPAQGDIAVKQIALRFVYSDNGIPNVLGLDSLTWHRNGQDETNLITLSDSLGNPITTLYQAIASHKKVYITYTAGNGEVTIPTGTTDVFTLEGTATGFGPTTDADAVQATFATDAVLPQSGYTYLNKGINNGVHAKLYNSPTASSGANGKTHNFVWSNKAAGASHYAIYGISSNDWFNAYGLVFQVTPKVIHSRPGGGPEPRFYRW